MLDTDVHATRDDSAPGRKACTQPPSAGVLWLRLLAPEIAKATAGRDNKSQPLSSRKGDTTERPNLGYLNVAETVMSFIGKET